ncbi:MAG: hypothetical protein FRX49_00687 [Trebouxia sp. A1-2]|nr:MAG: hypothetical protein FRX49_00687 [Trebouxia sp. A1-2]
MPEILYRQAASYLRREEDELLDPSDLQQKHALLRGAATLRGRQTEEDTEPCCKDVIVPIHLDDAVVVQPHACLTHRHAPGQSQVDGLAEPRRQTAAASKCKLHQETSKQHLPVTSHIANNAQMVYSKLELDT